MRRRDFLISVGGAAAWPITARAQQPALPVIGFLSARSRADSTHLIDAFRQGLRANGLVEGQNVTVEYRWAHGDYARLPELARELVNRRVSVLLGIGGDASALAAKAATKTIPVVFGMGSDPVQAGMVASLNRPGGNVTGVYLLINDLEAKRLGLLNELVPGNATIGALLNPKFPPVAQQTKDVNDAAQAIGRPVNLYYASNDAELDIAFGALVNVGAAALLSGADPFFDTRKDKIIGFTARRRLPAIYHFREWAVAGGLMSYGISLTDTYIHFGDYAARIVQGAKPADLPVMQSVKFELVINLQTAKELVLTIPPGVLAIADEVIE